MGNCRPRCRRRCTCRWGFGGSATSTASLYSYADCYNVGKIAGILELDNYRLQLARQLLTSQESASFSWPAWYFDGHQSSSVSGKCCPGDLAEFE